MVRHTVTCDHCDKEGDATYFKDLYPQWRPPRDWITLACLDPNGVDPWSPMYCSWRCVTEAAMYRATVESQCPTVAERGAD